MTDLAAIKSAARKAAFARRKLAFDTGHPAPAALLQQVLAAYRGLPLSSYMAMRTEIDPLPAMLDELPHGPVAVPVIIAKGAALRFRSWTPDAPLADGGFGAMIPVTGDWVTPQVLIVPLVAFDRAGNRLGYGGGFYDRTLAELRAAGPVTAIGFAWDQQEADDLPIEPTDQPLDLIVTQTAIFAPADKAGSR